MRITVELGTLTIVVGRVGFGWRRGGTRAFTTAGAPSALWRYWWGLRAGVVSIGRDWMVEYDNVVEFPTPASAPGEARGKAREA